MDTMNKTLNQRIYETPADVKKAIHDFGYEEGKRAMQVSEELKKELGNAIATYGQILTKAFLGISTSGFEHLMKCTEEELKHKMQMLKDFHSQL